MPEDDYSAIRRRAVEVTEADIKAFTENCDEVEISATEEGTTVKGRGCRTRLP